MLITEHLKRAGDSELITAIFVLKKSHNIIIFFSLSQLYCCGVEDTSWSVYRSSQWFYNQPGELEERIQVPESCCVQDQYGAVFDHEQCQLYRGGPPKVKHGPRNKALQYRVWPSASLVNLRDWSLITGSGGGGAGGTKQEGMVGKGGEVKLYP